MLWGGGRGQLPREAPTGGGTGGLGAPGGAHLRAPHCGPTRAPEGDPQEAEHVQLVPGPVGPSRAETWQAREQGRAQMQEHTEDGAGPICHPSGPSPKVFKNNLPGREEVYPARPSPPPSPGVPRASCCTQQNRPGQPPLTSAQAQAQPPPRSSGGGGAPLPQPPRRPRDREESSVLPVSRPGSPGSPSALQPSWELAGQRPGALSHPSPMPTRCHNCQYPWPSDPEASPGAMVSIGRACGSGALARGPSFVSDSLCNCGHVPACLWASVVPFVQWKE